MQQVRLVSADDELLIALNGEIDAATSEDFYAQAFAMYSHDKKNLVFDCAGLEFIDSTTLGTFVKLFKHVKQDGNGFKLINLRRNVKKIFEICALDRIMEIE